MVRERVKNRTFAPAFLIPTIPDEKELKLAAIFPDGHPLAIDVGCGRGRFLLAHAAKHPGINFLGIDRSLLRLQKIDRKAVAAGLSNIRLINADASLILQRLPAASVATFFVFFPDPWPKRRHASKRLVSAAFIDLVFNALVPGGIIHLCTDHADYFASMTRCWTVDKRFHPVAPFLPTEEEETDFALIFRTQNLTTHRCSFCKTVTPS